jgi:hypothetical protein
LHRATLSMAGAQPPALDFITTQVATIEGWLTEAAAHLSAALLTAQANSGTLASVLEIGVYQGKYLSLLFHLSRQLVIGVDLFQGNASQAKVISNFNRLFGELDRLKLVSADSRQLSSDVLKSLSNGNAFSFISIDGDHSSEAVHHDLALADELLCREGLVALDDFLNPRAMGVAEGAFRYFLKRSKTGLAPFAYCGNKLFLARPFHTPFYRDVVLDYIASYPGLEMNSEFSRLAHQSRSWVDQPLLGEQCLIV